MRRSDHWPLLIISLLALITFALGATYLDAQSMWRDEIDAIRFAAAPWQDVVTNFTLPGWNGPLYFLLLRGWMAATGASAYTVRFISLLSGVLCVPLVYVAGCRLFDRTTGIMATLLAASAPYLAWYSVEAKMYTWVTALTLIAVYALRRAFDGPGRRWWAVHIIATSLAAYSHIIAALLIPVQALMYLTWRPRTRRQWVGWVASAACLVLPYLPLLRWQLPLLFQSRTTGFAPVSVGQILATLLAGWSIGPYPPRDWLRPLSKAMAGLAAWGLCLAVLLPLSRHSGESRHRNRARSALSMAIWATVPAIAVGVISLWQPIFTDRYLIWSAPAFYILVALGLCSFTHLWNRASLVVLPTAVLLFAVSITSSQLQLAGSHKADFRAAANFIASYDVPHENQAVSAESTQLTESIYLPFVVGRGTPGDAVSELILFQIPHAKHAFDYYSQGQVHAYADGPFTNHRSADGYYLMYEEQVASTMAQITAGHDPIWLIATEVEMWDERRLTQKWLDATLRREFVAHFAHIDVFRYSREPPH